MLKAHLHAWLCYTHFCGVSMHACNIKHVCIVEFATATWCMVVGAQLIPTGELACCISSSWCAQYTYAVVHVYTSELLYIQECNLAHTCTWSLLPFVILPLLPPGNLKKHEIEIKANQAYETVTKASSSKSARQVHIEPCPAYGVVAQTHHWSSK